MVIPSWFTLKLNLYRDSRPHSRYAQQQQNNKHKEFGEISPKVWQNLKWGGKSCPWKVAILTKMVNWQKHPSLFHKVHLLVTIFCRKVDKFSEDSTFSLNSTFYKQLSFVISYQYSTNPWQISSRFPFSSNLSLYKECISTFEYSSSPGQISPHFSFSPGANLINFYKCNFQVELLS